MMLHTWNWIPHPDGLFVHENRAIPFLRDGLRVRSQAELDTPEGQAALDTLRLAHGDETRRYEGAFLVADLGRFDAWMTRRLLRHGERLGEEAVARMRAAEQLGDPATGGRRRPRRRRRARDDAQRHRRPARSHHQRGDGALPGLAGRARAPQQPVGHARARARVRAGARAELDRAWLPAGGEPGPARS